MKPGTFCVVGVTNAVLPVPVPAPLAVAVGATRVLNAAAKPSGNRRTAPLVKLFVLHCRTLIGVAGAVTELPAALRTEGPDRPGNRKAGVCCGLVSRMPFVIEIFAWIGVTPWNAPERPASAAA